MASFNPGTGNDAAHGFAAGSRWFNTTTHAEYICTNATVGAAQWQTLSNFLPLTRLAATGLDRVVSRREEVIADTAKYAGSDLLCYRATTPESLVTLQHDTWQPLLDWAAEHYGTRFVVTEGIKFVEQPDEAKTRLKEAVSAYADVALSALYNLTHTSGSVVIALAVAEGRLTAEGAFAAAQVEELYQIERWGDDPHAKKQREGVQKDIEACTKFLALLGNKKLRG